METLDPQTCYRALLTHDSRFDGIFFVGVKTTGIYCRPICSVRTPKPTNCEYFENAALAEEKGFRPCLRCRPELAPGLSPIDATHRLACRAKQRVDDGFLCEARLSLLAVHLGVSERHLRRVFQQEFGVSLVAYAQTRRLLLAKQLLTETHLSVTEIAFSSGFESLRRFNALFKERYQMAPTALRVAKSSQKRQGDLTISLNFRPPFAWKAHLDFLAARSITGVETVSDECYMRSVHLRMSEKHVSGWLAVTCDLKRSALNVQLSHELVPYLSIILGRIRHLFDVSCQPDLIESVLGPELAHEKGLRLPGTFDGFEMAVRAILGQQISVKNASRLASKFVEKFGTPLASPLPGITHLFPTAEALAQVDSKAIQQLGMPHARANTLQSLARLLADENLCLEPGADVDEVKSKLQTVPGIGPWTAEYIAMRALAWPDAFLSSDLGVLKSLGTKSAREAAQLAERWKPWRAYAVMHLWRRGSKSESQEENTRRIRKGVKL